MSNFRAQESRREWMEEPQMFFAEDRKSDTFRGEGSVFSETTTAFLKGSDDATSNRWFSGVAVSETSGGFSTASSCRGQIEMPLNTKISFQQWFLWIAAGTMLFLSVLFELAYFLTKAQPWELVSYTFFFCAEVFMLVLPPLLSKQSMFRGRSCFLSLNFISLMFCLAAWAFASFGLTTWTHLCIRFSEIILILAAVPLHSSASKLLPTPPAAIYTDRDSLSSSTSNRPSLPSSVQLKTWAGTNHPHESLAFRLADPAPTIFVDLELTHEGRLQTRQPGPIM